MAKVTPAGGISFEQFFAAIGGQESGGNYGAVNGRTKASGKYQILKSNIGPWSRKYLGYEMSYDDYMRKPQLQERLARAVLSDYYGKWGARGAAAAWYSGSPDKANNYNKFRPNEPSVGEYVDQVLARIGKGGMPTASQTASQPLAQQPVAQFEQGAGVEGLEVNPDFLGRTEEATPIQQASGLPGMPLTPFTGAKGNSGQRDKIISEAMRYIGTPYKWGGTGPGGFDCSGLIQYVYGKFGISMPRISAQQASSGRRSTIDQLQAGDLIGWDNSSRNNGADHIAIYLGNGQILEAPKAGSSVRIRNLGQNEGYFGVALNI